jgi:DNA-binding MarR family transcriptional regulator
MNPHFEAIIEIIRTGHWFTDAVTKELKEYGIYEPQFNVLRILKGAKGKPVSVNTILEKMIQRSSNVTRIVDKLCAKGLVERTISEFDRRKMDILITTKGEELLEKLNVKVSALHAPLEKNLTDDEALHLKQLIQKMKGDK